MGKQEAEREKAEHEKVELLNIYAPHSRRISTVS